jgi:calcium-dependent protein kinase
MIDCLKNEVEIMLKVDHPHIAKYFETYDEPRYIYMVMELLSGGEFYDKILDGGDTMSEKDAANVIYKCILALNHCHE